VDGAPGTLLSIEGLEKTYPNGTTALRGVTFAVAERRIQGLVGANGAGKSTLIKILSGAVPASGGTMTWLGTPRVWRQPVEALQAGIATIHQHIPLAATLSVIENVFLAADRPWRRAGSERRQFRKLIEDVGYDIDPDAIVADLPIGRRQMVSILQAIATEARLLIMDEPTASLSDSEREIVFRTMRWLRDSHGTSILFISHFLDEVMDLCEHVTVLRDGEIVLDESRGSLNEQSLVAGIVGKKSAIYEVKRTSHDLDAARPVLEVTDLASPTGVRDVALSVRAGEIVGLAGVLGSGRSEILHAIFGADPAATGDVTVAGRAVRHAINGALDAGIVLVPEDRNGQALFPAESIRWNLSLPASDEICALNVFPVRMREEARARRIIDTFSVVASSSAIGVGQLSGGNAQKIALGRAMSDACKVLLLDEPTAGVDIGAKADIRRVIDDIAKGGVAVVVVISDFEELLSMCTRILVIANGGIVAERRPEDTSEHELVALASGLKH
jgi:ribose transport system ATP-binding protein